LGWAVFAPTTGVPAGALAGEYVGVSADVGRIEPHDSLAAAVASGIDCDQRDHRRVIAQVALALKPPTGPFNFGSR